MRLIVLLGLLLLPTVATGAEPDTILTGSAEIVLVDGSKLVGRVVEETDDSVVFESVSLGRLTVSRSQIVSIRYLDAVSPSQTPPPVPKHPGWRSDPDYNSVLLVPTPETLPRGSIYYRNFELLFNNIGYAVTDDVNLSFGFLFPVSSEVQVLALGAKWRLLSRETHPLGLALSAAGSGVTTEGDWEWLGTLSAIAGIGNRTWSVNGSIYHAFASGDDENFFLLAGDLQVGKGFKLLAEYGNSTGPLLEGEDFNGVINVGFRIFWDEVSFTLTGVRPLEVDGGSFIAFPLAVFSGHF